MKIKRLAPVPILILKIISIAMVFAAPLLFRRFVDSNELIPILVQFACVVLILFLPRTLAFHFSAFRLPLPKKLRAKYTAFENLPEEEKQLSQRVTTGLFLVGLSLPLILGLFLPYNVLTAIVVSTAATLLCLLPFAEQFTNSKSAAGVGLIFGASIILFMGMFWFAATLF